MKFGLAIILTNEVENKTDIIQSLSDELKISFASKQYGQDIKSYTIGIVCVSPQFEQFFKEKRPKYTKGKKVINPDGIPFTLEDSFEYDIKIDFESFKNANEEEVKRILAEEILASLVAFEKMKSKIKNSFKEDLEEHFRSQNLI
jgi:hypothetical protein